LKTFSVYHFYTQKWCCKFRYVANTKSFLHTGRVEMFLSVSANCFFFLLRLIGVRFFFFTEVNRGTWRKQLYSAYSGYPELWILRYPAHRYNTVPSPGFEPTTLWQSDVLTIRLE
jgi:hypothetical protein